MPRDDVLIMILKPNNKLSRFYALMIHQTSGLDRGALQQACLGLMEGGLGKSCQVSHPSSSRWKNAAASSLLEAASFYQGTGT